MKINGKTLKIMLLISFVGLCFLSCVSEAPNVDPLFITEEATSTDTGTVDPQLLSVYPGTNQTVVAPLAVQTGVNPDNIVIAVIFTHSMENVSIELRDIGSAITSAFTPDSTFKVFYSTPQTLSFSTDYWVRIDNIAYVSGDATRTLNFDNLGTFVPADPSNVEYQFQTGTGSIADETDPTFTSTSPADIATNVPVDLSGAYNGYIEIVFDDGINIPMIDPSTVNNTNIKLFDSTPSEVAGTLEIDATDTQLKTYRFYPDGILLYDESYTLDISISDSVCDFSGNPVTAVSISFNTIAETSIVPSIDSYSAGSVTDTQATIDWSTGWLSITHLDIEAGLAPAFPSFGAEDTHDTTTRAFSFTHTATGLTPNTLYSYKISADVDTTLGSGATFSSNTTVYDAFRTLPDTTEGATGNYILADAATTKSNISFEQIDTDTSYIFWVDSTSGVRGQYFDTSFSAQGTEWDRWADNTGDLIFNATGNVETINDGNDNVIVVRESGNIYGASVVDNAGALSYNWGGSAGPGTTMYSGTASNVSMALTDSGLTVNETSDGTHTAEMDYIYDSAASFSGSVTAGDHVLNTAATTPASYYADVTNVVDNNFLVLDGVVVSSVELGYSIGVTAESTLDTVYVSTTVDDSGPIDFTDGTFTMQSAFTVDTTLLIGLTALANAIDGGTATLTCTAIGAGTTTGYLVVTDSSGADIEIANTDAVLTEFGFTAGTYPGTEMYNIITNTFESYSDFSTGGLISNLAGDVWASITSESTANSPWTYTASNSNFTIDPLDFDYYANVSNGTSETTVLYDSGTDFNALGVLPNDIVINRITGETAKVTAIYGSFNEVLTLPDNIFETDGENFQILSLTDDTEFVTGGVVDTFPGVTITQAARDFSTDGVISGNIIYNMDTDSYAEVVSAGTTTITLSSQIFTSAGECFIIYGEKGMILTWDNGGDIYGKTVSTSSGTGIYPDTTTGSQFTISSNGATEEKPYVISDQNKNGIVIYQNDNSGFEDIRAKKISPDGTFQWGSPADTAGGLGIQIAANSRDDLIQDVISDNNGGAWILYTSHDVSPGTYRVVLKHINTSGGVSTLNTITAADNPVIARISTTEFAIAYELYTTIGSEVGKRINMRRYNNTPATVGSEVSVHVGVVSVSQLSPRIEQDGTGGFYISWLEMRYYPSIYYSIFAQRFVGATPQLGDDAFVGVPVLDDPTTTNVYDIEHGILYKSGPNGVFFWQDERSGNVDIYFEDL